MAASRDLLYGFFSTGGVQQLQLLVSRLELMVRRSPP